jgi:hypothetical protein
MPGQAAKYTSGQRGRRSVGETMGVIYVYEYHYEVKLAGLAGLARLVEFLKDASLGWSERKG